MVLIYDIKLSKNEAVKLKNPLNRDMAYLRNSLVPGILRALSFNEKRDSDFVRLYEIGSINKYDNKQYNNAIENRQLGIIWSSNKTENRNPLLRQDAFWSEFFFRIGNGESLRGVSKDLGVPFQSVWSLIMDDEKRRITYEDARIS